MLAIPVDKLGENPSVSKCFGKSKWFAIIEKDIISFEKNKEKKGCEVANWLYEIGVTETIVNWIGKNPLHKLQENHICCYFSKERVSTLTEALDKLALNSYLKVDDSNADIIIDKENQCEDEKC